jgi:glutamate/tyrosine decarboxylase-like PLP-dependent enzyme
LPASVAGMEPLLDLAAQLGAEHIDSAPDRHVGWRAEAGELRAALGRELSLDGEDGETVLRELAAGVEPGLVTSTSPRYFGFVIGGVLPVARAADWLTIAWDQNAGGYSCSPSMAIVEELAGGWVRDLLGLPAGASHGFTTGCQMAHVTGLAVARHAVLARHGWDVQQQGLNGAPPIRVVVPADRHVTVDAAVRLLGLGIGSMRPVACDDQARVIPQELERELAREPDLPTIVTAQAGNVNTGSFEDFGAICELAQAHGAWVHVDGAFGLWAAASERRRGLTAGVEQADSWATDGHKTLNVPHDCGLVFVRDPDTHWATIAVDAHYLQRGHGERDNGDWSPDFSRRARAVPVYAALRSLGRRGVAQLVDGMCDRAQEFAQILGADPRAEILNDVEFNQVLVRFGDSDAVTNAVTAGIQQEGTCWASATEWRGRRALRISVSNWATTPDDVERSAAAMLAQVSG